MKKFTEYKQLNLNAVADNVVNFGKPIKLLKIRRNTKGKPEYVFMKDRLSANGMLGITT